MKQEQLEKAKKNRARISELAYYLDVMNKTEKVIYGFTYRNSNSHAKEEKLFGLELEIETILSQCKNEIALAVNREINILKKQFEEI